MIHWTNDAVDSRQRSSSWREVVCQTVFDVPANSPPEKTCARTAGGHPGSAGLVAFDRVGHETVKTRQPLAPAPRDCYLINLQLTGHSRIAQDGVCLTLAPTEIAILDGRRPFHIQFPESISRIVAFLPRDMVDRRAPWLRPRPARKLMTSDCPYADLARRHLLHLAAGNQELNESVTSLLMDNLFNLFTLANMQAAAGFDGPRRELPLESLLAFCRQHLHEANLSPHFVAAHFRISVRTLHLRFEKLGQSFSRWLLEARLEACGTALRDPHSAGRTICEIAYRCGFNDLSHFNRTFRARFKTTPRGWRTEQGFGRTPEQQLARPPRSSVDGDVEFLVLS
jgi:AraC family transcriptional activator of tynA and feaB